VDSLHFVDVDILDSLHCTSLDCSIILWLLTVLSIARLSLLSCNQILIFMLSQLLSQYSAECATPTERPKKSYFW
jgi:hypothetical protein